MKRPLVLTTEGARHPFRRSLPEHVVRASAVLRPIKSSDQDWKLFMLSFTAFFIAAYSYLL